MDDRPETWWHRVGGITAAVLVYGGVLAMLVWMLLSYPIEH